MLGETADPLGAIPGEQNGNRVEVGAGESADPMVGMVRAGVAQHLRAGDHALLELLREALEGGFVHPQSPEPVPGEGQRHPALARGERRLDVGRGLDLLEQRAHPRPSASGVPERDELVLSRERGGAGQQDVLDISQLEHGLTEAHCIWSSMSENAALSLSAFLISSAVTKGYSAYSRKLGRWCSRTNL